MFKLVWKQVVSATAVAFTTIDDDYIIEKAISGFRQCATLASTFQLPEVFDFIVLSLSYATGLLEDSVPPRSSSFPVVDVEGQSITVSPLSVKFGTGLRAQLAAVVMFTISNGNGNHLREGWAPVSVLRVRVRHRVNSARYSKCSKHFSCTLSSPRGCCKWKTSSEGSRRFLWLHRSLNNQPRDQTAACSRLSRHI